MLGADKLVDAVTAASDLMRAAERISIVGAGIAAARSTRDAGQDGLAQERGHRTSAGLVQDIAGISRTEAQRRVRLGLSLLEADPSAAGNGDAAESEFGDEGRAARRPWHAVLSEAMLQGLISPHSRTRSSAVSDTPSTTDRMHTRPGSQQPSS
ncbi:hypothetical protein [Microbacterium suwonense]|uniref:hypothetical protein n=1 Tax=Microbacterium suwonense TaxID=683047 RepID=UPI0025748DA5|nr:hypothetical protein [Microbacterium suwonense]